MNPLVSHVMFDAGVVALLFGPIAALGAYARFEAWRQVRRRSPPWWM